MNSQQAPVSVFFIWELILKHGRWESVDLTDELFSHLGNQ